MKILGKGGPVPARQPTQLIPVFRPPKDARDSPPPSAAVRDEIPVYGPAERPDRHVLERDVPLSRSLVWRVQRSYFTHRGPAAWSRGEVPSSITSNPWIAGAYARVVFGWLRDWHAELDPSQPVYIVELGCGSGRFGFLFLRRLLDLLERSRLRGTGVRYVLTDFTASNLDPLRCHPRLQPLIAAGHLDFALFDATADSTLRLLTGGEELAVGTLRNPLVVIANYLFDSIPQDCFTVQGGRLYHELVTASSDRPETDLDDPEIFSRLEIAFRPEPVTGEPYPDDPLAGEILRRYTRTLRRTSLPFPVDALRCLHRLQNLAGGRQLLLSADKGAHREADLDGRGLPGFTLHGSFSMSVNFHAISELFRQRGGEVLEVPCPWSHLHIVGGLLGAPAAGLVETRLAFHEEIATRRPDDFFALKAGIEESCEEWLLEPLLAFLRFSGGDPEAYFAGQPALRRRARAAPHLRESLRQLVHEIWENHFPLPGDLNDLAFHLGTLLVELACPQEALEMFSHSLDPTLPAAVARAYNTAICHWQLADWEAARQWLDRALELDPACEPAAALRPQIDAKLAAALPGGL